MILIQISFTGLFTLRYLIIMYLFGENNMLHQINFVAVNSVFRQVTIVVYLPGPKLLANHFPDNIDSAVANQIITRHHIILFTFFFLEHFIKSLSEFKRTMHGHFSTKVAVRRWLRLLFNFLISINCIFQGQLLRYMFILLF